jgi:GH15 family glucan-1,4-alpha-glucosidase
LSRGTANHRNKEDPLLTEVFSPSQFAEAPLMSPKHLLHDLLQGTNDYWNAWIRGSTYNGSWKEAVHRSALALKLLIYEPTGSVMTQILMTMVDLVGRCCSCQSNIQSTRIYRWNEKLVRFGIQLAVRHISTAETCHRDYRASWIRDASFTLYALIRLGFTHEADGTFTVDFFRT